MAIDRLALRTTVVYSVAWTTALVVLAGFAVAGFARVRDRDFDAQLAMHATAVYGLTYFDSEGGYHIEPMLREPGIVHGPFDVYVVDPDRDALLYASDGARFPIDLHARHILEVARGAMGDARDVSLADGQRVRILTKTTFDDADRARAAIVVVGDPSPHRRDQWHFATVMVVVTALLAALGILVARIMTERTLAPSRRDLAARERFLHAAAHELRTPVTGLLAVVDAGGIEGPIAKLSQEASRVLEQVLAYARLDAGLGEVRCEPFRFDLLVESLLPEEIPRDAEPCVVQGDVRLIEIAIRNLLSNAERHGAGIRDIRVSSGVVIVRDRGPGFPARLLAAKAPPSFEPGPASEGWGLGLVIVHQIAELHGGRLLLQNHADGGGEATLDISRVVLGTSS